MAFHTVEATITITRQYEIECDNCENSIILQEAKNSFFNEIIDGNIFNNNEIFDSIEAEIID